jgi:4-hydroxyproline epimerase
VCSDVAWGGNWFFLIASQGPQLSETSIVELTEFGSHVRRILLDSGIKGKDGDEVYHIEVFRPPSNPEWADSRNFVLCPGGAYDRSPCGTGVSAKLAPGQIWRQSSILNQVFECTYQWFDESRILPTIRGRAWNLGESSYHFDPSDPFRYGGYEG